MNSHWTLDHTTLNNMATSIDQILSPISFAIAAKPSPSRQSLLLQESTPSPTSLSLSSSTESITLPTRPPTPPPNVETSQSQVRDLTSQIAVSSSPIPSSPQDNTTSQSTTPVDLPAPAISATEFSVDSSSESASEDGEDMPTTTQSNLVVTIPVVPTPAIPSTSSAFAAPQPRLLEYCSICENHMYTAHFNGVYCDGCIVQYYRVLTRQDYMTWDRVQYALLPLTPFAAYADNSGFKLRAAEYKNSCDGSEPTYNRETRQIFARNAKSVAKLLILHYGNEKRKSPELAKHMRSVPLYIGLTDRQWSAWRRLLDLLNL